MTIKPNTHVKRRPTASCSFRVCGLLFITLLSDGLAQPGPRGNLYTVPNSTFFQQPVGESVVTINDTSGSIATLQGVIDAARLSNPATLMVINLMTGTHYTVNSDPLQLDSDMCLAGAGATIAAAASSIPATSLIRISPGSSYASVSDVTLDGNSADVRGIEAAGVSRVNIDQVRALATGREGIFLQGLGSTVFDNELTVTRCTVYGATSSSGIHIRDATQAICMENTASNNLVGITISASARCTVVNNRCKSNGSIGLDLPDAEWCKVLHNLCSGNPTGLSTGATSEKNMLVSNAVGDATTGIRLSGTRNTLYDNAFLPGVITLLDTLGTSHNVVANTTPLTAAGHNYFHPPTVANDHTDAVMNSTPRVDLAVAATTLSAIQTQYDTARAVNPTAVLVLRLTAPQITGDATLVLGSRTCVLIDGTIHLAPGVAAISALNESFLSVSGGTILGGNTTGRNGLSFDGCSRLLVDQVTLRDFGDKNTRVANSDVIALAGGGTPCIVANCTINGGAARGIWTKDGTAGFILTDNTVSDVNMDGIDLDGFTSGAIAKFNTVSINVRYGIFVEEAAKHNQLVGNVAVSNSIGINVYSFAAGPTAFNTLVGNACSSNDRGIRFGARSGLLTEHNFSFNNSVVNTTVADPQRGALDAQGQGSENYFSQHFLAGNPLDIDATTSAVFFNSPSTQGNTAPILSIIADQAILENTSTDPIAFTIYDEETPASSLTVSGTSSDTNLVPDSGIVFSGTGTNRTVTVTPATDQNGAVTLTVTVHDGLDSTAGTFLLDVIPNTPINTWRHANFGTTWNDAAIAGDAVDPDDDGLVNLMEYALGEDPNNDATPDPVQGSIINNHPTLTFTRNTDSGDISFTVQGTYHLDEPWIDLAYAANGVGFIALTSGVAVIESGAGAIRSVEVQDFHLLMDPQHTTRFLRLAAAHPSASVTLSDDFESYTVGNEVGSPWTVTDTDAQDGPSPLGQSLDIVSDDSFFSTGRQAVRYVDNNTDRSNPDLLYTLPASWAGPLNIQFDYKVDANSGQNITMFLRGVDGAADGYLRLRSGGALRNQLDAGTELIKGLPQGDWMHVDITTSAINPSGLETWEISATRQDGTFATLTTTIRQDVDTAYQSILFQDGSGADQTSDWTIDNFRVTLIPEP